MSAVSKRLTPASRHISTYLVAVATSVDPTTSKPPRPPNVMVPRVMVETKRPERPRRRYSIGSSLRLVHAAKSAKHDELGPVAASPMQRRTQRGYVWCLA